MAVDLHDLSEANQPAIAAYCAEFVMGWTVELESYPSPHVKGKTSYSKVVRHVGPTGHHYSFSMGCTEESFSDDKWLGVSLPNPFKSADDDYAVLKHVRETWDGSLKEQSKQLAFGAELIRIWNGRCSTGDFIYPSVMYKPGDYAVAACRVKQGESDGTSV